MHISNHISVPRKTRPRLIEGIPLNLHKDNFFRHLKRNLTEKMRKRLLHFVRLI